jgi:predicted dehydrogenase
MDYTTQPLIFRARKLGRYVRLYGPRRAFVKALGQYHMKGQLPPIARSSKGSPSRAHVAILGCGNFAFSNVAYYLRRHYGRVIRAVMDVDEARAASLAAAYGVDYYATDADEILSDPAIDLVFVASNHASHAPYAAAALERGKSVHIEKPHVVTFAQLERLRTAMETSSGKVALGFNRPQSELGERVQGALWAESGATMLNWFIAGHELPPEHWYYREEEGGRVLGNLCHWTDFVLQMIEPSRRYPIKVIPTRAEASDVDVAVTYIFGDGSIAAITFSAKGHTFEGVRESFAAHRGNALVSLTDFQRLTIERRERKERPFQLFRDHGHEAAIRRSYAMVRPRPGAPPSEGASLAYVWETADLFLKTKEALERNVSLVAEPFPACPAPAAPRDGFTQPLSN